MEHHKIYSRTYCKQKIIKMIVYILATLSTGYDQNVRLKLLYASCFISFQHLEQLRLQYDVGAFQTRMRQLWNRSSQMGWNICRQLIHGGTTEESNCSYLLPRAAAAGSNGTNKGQIHKVAVDEIARFLVYRMDVTKSQLSAHTGIPVCLVREIWQFRVFAGKEVTPLREEGNSQQFHAGKKATHFHYKWFIDIWQKDKTERKERTQCEIVNWKYVSRGDEQMKTTCLIRPRGDVSNTVGTEWRCLKHI